MPHQVRQDKLFGHFVSDILGLSNAHTSMGAAFALLCLAPSEPTCCTSEMSINEFITASEVYKRFTWNIFKVKHFTLHISHLIIYSGIFIATHAGAGGFDVSVMVELD